MEREQRGLSEKVSQSILEYVVENGLEPGDKLPNEYELAQMICVGRSSVREAVKILVSRNVLEVRQGAGTFVSPKRGVVEDPLGLKLIADKHRLARDLMDVRMLLEPQIAAYAAQNASEKEIEAILRLCDETQQQIREGSPHLYKDMEFHTCIAYSSKNLVVPQLLPVLHRAIEVFIDVTNSSLLQETVSTHREIAEAIRCRDSVAAHDAMYLHLIYNRRQIKSGKAAPESNPHSLS